MINHVEVLDALQKRLERGSSQGSDNDTAAMKDKRLLWLWSMATAIDRHREGASHAV